MTKFYLTLYAFFTTIANYFWKRALQPIKKRSYHEVNTKTKKVTKRTTGSNSKKSKKKVKRKRKEKNNALSLWKRFTF